MLVESAKFILFKLQGVSEQVLKVKLGGLDFYSTKSNFLDITGHFDILNLKLLTLQDFL